LLSATAGENPLAAYMVNANGTFHILEAARLFGVEKVIFLSTITTYGSGIPERVNDDVVQRPQTIYGVTKVFGERLGEYYHRKFGINFRGVRFPAIIGPGRDGDGASSYSSPIVVLLFKSQQQVGFNQVYIDEATRIPLLYIKIQKCCYYLREFLVFPISKLKVAIESRNPNNPILLSLLPNRLPALQSRLNLITPSLSPAR